MPRGGSFSFFSYVVRGGISAAGLALSFYRAVKLFAAFFGGVADGLADFFRFFADGLADFLGALADVVRDFAGDVAGFFGAFG